MFNLPTYKRFNLTPRYWDPKKEEREARERRVRAELGLDNDDKEYVPHIKGQFTREFARRQANRSSLDSRRTLRIFMILIMLFMGAFYVFVKNPEGLLKLFGL